LGTLTRRDLLASFAAIPLAGCQSGEKARLRYRVIAWFQVDGRPFEASTVMEIHYARVTNSLTGMGGSTRLYGEALIADFPGKGTLYILPQEHTIAGPLRQIWEPAILLTLGTDSSIGSLKQSDFELIRKAKGRMPFRMSGNNRLPAFVAFKDERNPKTIYEITPANLDQAFQGVTFKGLDIEITEEPITAKLMQRLDWLNSPKGQEIFERDPPGKRRPESDRPIGFLIVRAHFFGSGSW